MSKMNTPFFSPRPVADSEISLDKTFIPDALYDKLWPNIAHSPFVIDDIYVLNNQGELEKQEGLSTKREDVNNIASGRIFTRDSEGYLRQLQLEREDDGKYRLSASRPIKIVEPEKITVWTHIRAFFGHKASKAKKAAHNELKKFNAAFRNLAAKQDSGIQLNPPEVEYRVETLEKDAPKVEIPLKEVELKSTMSKDDFYIQLNKDSFFSHKEFNDVLEKPNVTAQEIVEAHTKLLKSDIARRILVITNYGNQNMAHAQHTYLILTEDLSPSQIFLDAVDAYASAKQTGDPTAISHARLRLRNEMGSEQAERMIERRRPSTTIYNYDDYYASITEQMKEGKVIRVANQRMNAREKDLEEREQKKQFGEDLKEAAKFTSKDVQAVVTGDDPDCDKYLEALANMMIGQVANMMLADKNLNLVKAKPIYEELTDSIYDYIGQKHRQDAYNIIDTLKDEGQDAALKQSDELINTVTKNGLNEVFATLNAADPENEHLKDLTNQLKQPSKEKPAADNGISMN